MARRSSAGSASGFLRSVGGTLIGFSRGTSANTATMRYRTRSGVSSIQVPISGARGAGGGGRGGSGSSGG